MKLNYQHVASYWHNGIVSDSSTIRPCFDIRSRVASTQILTLWPRIESKVKFRSRFASLIGEENLKWLAWTRLVGKACLHYARTQHSPPMRLVRKSFSLSAVELEYEGEIHQKNYINKINFSSVEILNTRGIACNLIKAIRSTFVFIDTGNQLTAPVKTNKGVRECCCLYPTLFNIHVDNVSSKMENNS